MPLLRRATVEDAPLLTQHRHLMYADNDLAPEERLCALDVTFEPWVRQAIADGTYVGLLLVEKDTVLAGAGIYLMPFPPHWMHDEALRAYLLNFYTVPEARGQGLAKTLLKACVDEAHSQGATVVTLHASKFGKPIYEKFGFEATTEMMLQS